jgi:hypothetical protein
VSLQTVRGGIASGALLLLGWLGAGVVLRPLPVVAQEEPAHSEELSRKVKSKVPPVYPEIARRMNITGTVRMMVVVSPSGAVKNTKVVGGHPPASEESSGIVEFKFHSAN